MKQRNIAACIIYSLLTCGIYTLYWYVCMVDDVNFVSQNNNTSGGKALLFSFLTCGIYTYFWVYTAGERLDNVKMQQGYPSSNQAIIYLLLTIFGLGIVSFALIQNELNKYVAQA